MNFLKRWVGQKAQNSPLKHLPDQSCCEKSKPEYERLKEELKLLKEYLNREFDL
jgi:hypothetical protein